MLILCHNAWASEWVVYSRSRIVTMAGPESKGPRETCYGKEAFVRPLPYLKPDGRCIDRAPVCWGGHEGTDV